MEITWMPVESITPYENNPRINDKAVDPVAQSIRDFGFKSPILLDRDNVIIAGHTRLKAAKKLGMDKVPCVVCDDLTDDQVKALRLVDNKVAEFADWDFAALKAEIESIDFDLEPFGFVVSDIGDMFDEDADTPKDEKPPKEAKVYTVTCPCCGQEFEISEDELK